MEVPRKDNRTALVYAGRIGSAGSLVEAIGEMQSAVAAAREIVQQAAASGDKLSERAEVKLMSLEKAMMATYSTNLELAGAVRRHVQQVTKELSEATTGLLEELQPERRN